MDRTAIARAQRRRQALEALEFERDRAAALQGQLEAIVAEIEGSGIDEAAFAKMSAEDVELVRTALEDNNGLEGFEELDGLEEEELFELGEDEPEDENWEQEVQEAEITRLEQEIAASSRRQQAFDRYLEALGE